MTIRTGSRAETFESVDDYHRRQSENYLRRNYTEIRREFWARKAADSAN